ncbi:TPA: toprim domain-containing protein [Escherichia coli]|nr:toprim domain-containing protein [Escherichia coli]
MNTIDAVKGQWAKIFAHYGLPPITGRKHFKGKCPICGQKGKFRIDDKDGRGTYICTCGSGNGFQLLERTQGKDFKTLADEIDVLIGNQREKEAILPTKINKNNLFQRITGCYSKLPILKNTPAMQYLQNRGVFELPLDNVRYCDHQPVRNSSDKFQAIWSLATDAKGQLCYLHRTYLQGDKKAPLDIVKKMTAVQDDNYLEYAESVAIRMFLVDTTLGIAEGIETALSCKQLYGVNTWSVINTNFMKKFKAPKGVIHLVIFTDMDWNAAGHAAAMECAHKNLLSNNDVETVSVRWPDNGDFNDMLTEACEVRELVFSRQHKEVA